MKKFLAICTAVMLVSTPAMAKKGNQPCSGKKVVLVIAAVISLSAKTAQSVSLKGFADKVIEMKRLFLASLLVLVGCDQDETKAVQGKTAEVATNEVKKPPVKETGIRTLVINDISEINANAEQIKAEISAEDRALIEEYFSRAETIRLVSGDKSMFGVSLGEAIEKTKNHFEKKSAMDDKIIAFNETYKAELVSFEKSTKYDDGIDLKIKFTNTSDKVVSAIDGWVELEVEGIDKSDSLLLGTHKFDKPLAKGESAEITYWTEANSLATIKIEQGNAIAKMFFKDVTILFDDGTTDEVKQMY